MFTPQLIKNVSAGPGVYLMRDAADQVLYVGKAISLRKRLQSYVRVDSGTSRAKTAALLSKVAAVNTMLTRTAKEALILEASLIKQHRPRYNVLLRDDKSYPHLKVTTQEEWPRLLMTRRVIKDGARYFGPYTSVTAMWATLRLLNSLFPLRRCKTSKFKSDQRACLNFEMKRCPGPCIAKISPQDYRKRVERVLTTLEGRKRELTRDLEQQMNTAAAGLRFEEAAALRDQVRALNQTLEKQVVLLPDKLGGDQDVFGFIRQQDQVAAALLLMREGALVDKREFFLGEPVGADRDILAELLRRYYEPAERLIPRRIFLPFIPEGTGVLAEWLSEKRGGSVQLTIPRRGDKKALVELATDNALQGLKARQQRRASWEYLTEAIRRSLRLPAPPQRIECLDISNFGGHEAVGSLVAFRDGQKDSSRYRHFKIRSLDTPDDYAMMREVLRRHLSHGAKEQTLPDLLVLDGGKGQLGVAQAVMAELNLVQGPALAAIAKDRQDEEGATVGARVFCPGRKNPLALAAHSPVLLFLMRIRDEAHRYGVTFHRKLRGQKQLSSQLDQIPGVGPARRQALLKTLGSLRAVAAASREELAAVSGIGPELATSIYAHLHPALERSSSLPESPPVF